MPSDGTRDATTCRSDYMFVDGLRLFAVLQRGVVLSMFVTGRRGALLPT
jgi:hypothetical protein